MSSTPMKLVAPTAAHHAFRNALHEAIEQHGRDLDASELLALQDPLIMTAEMAMEIVAINITGGNRDAIEPLLTQTGGSA